MEESTNHRIRQVREALGLSQRKFSQILSLSNGYIAGIETGIRRVNPRLIKMIALQFGVNEDWIITGEGAMFTAPEGDEKFTKLVSLFKELPPKYQELVFKMIEVLLKDKG